MEIRFDQLQKLEGFGDFLVSVVAGLVVAEGGLGPVECIGEASGISENHGGVAARCAGSEAVLHGFPLVNGLAVVVKSGVGLAGGIENVSELVVNGP